MQGVVGPAEADVDRALVVAVGVVEEDGLVALGDVAGLPQVGEVDDGELQTLAAVDGQDLDGLLVGLQAPAALLVAGLLPGGGDALAQPGGQRSGAHLLGRRGGVQQLGDVAQVGQRALPVHGAQDAFGQALGAGDRLAQGGHPALAQHARPAVQAAVEVLELVVAGGGHSLGGPAQEWRQRRRPGAGGGAGALDGLQQGQPGARGVGAQHAARPVDDGRDVDGLQRVADQRRVAMRAHQDGHVAGAQALAAQRRAVRRAGLDLGLGGEQGDEVVGEVAGDVLACGGVGGAAGAGEARRRTWRG